MKLDLHSIATTCMLVAVIVFTSCSDDEVINNPTIPEQPEQLTELTAQYNTNIAAYQAMMNGKAEIVDYTSDEKGNYKLQLSNRQFIFKLPTIKIFPFLELIKKVTGIINWKVLHAF